MSKVGNYIVGASVVAVMAGNPDVAEAQNVVNGEQENKIENVQELKEELKNDSTIAWNEVAVLETELKENKTEGQSKEELKENLAKIHPKKENVKESKNENNNDKVVQAMMMKQRSD